MTERQMSRRRAIFCGGPDVSGIGGPPLGALRQLVEPEDALRARVLGMGDDVVDDLLHLHAGTLTGVMKAIQARRLRADTR